MTELDQLKLAEALSESRRQRPNNSSAISDEDKRNIELAKRHARDIPTKAEVVKYAVEHGWYSAQTGEQIMTGTWPSVMSDV